jgi:two-component system cell cycle sensor histidine kinase/response regulator CckA
MSSASKANSGASWFRFLFDGKRRQAAKRQRRALLAAFEADSRGQLLIDRNGVELYRNAEAARLFGPADDPCAPLGERAVDDERQMAEVARLRLAASLHGAHKAELALPAPEHGREWLAVTVRGLANGLLHWTVQDISSRRVIDETWRREREMLADFIDFLPVGFYSADTEGRFRFINQRLAEWIGGAPEQLIGARLPDVLGIEPDPEEDRAEMRLKGRNGDVFQAFVTHTVFDEGGETLTRSVVVRDLMPERHRERALKVAERRFRWLFEESPVAIAMVDPDGSISSANETLLGMVGAEEEELLGRSVTDLMMLDDRAAVAEQMSRVLLGASLGARLPVRLTGDGRELAAMLHIGPTDEDGALSGLMLHFIDTTEHKNLEIQIAQNQKMQAMGQLAGGVAHDFNNLLTAMIGFCDLLLQRHGPGDISFADIMQIKQNANRAASLVRQLLAFSRRQALQPKLFDVTDALADLSNLLRRLLGETMELTITHGRDLGLVRVDPGQFDQVIINLSVNARDAMQGGGGLLSISTRAATVERPYQRGDDIMPPGSYVAIEVTDNGTGIADEHVGRIFEPFFSTKEVGAGTGLGLSTVYGIVRQTDGYIFVDSEVGSGTRFTIYLPRFEQTEAVAAAVPAPTESDPPARRDLTGVGTVLLVEDEDAVRLFGSRALKNQGYNVIEARSAETALEALRVTPQVDVLVTDVVMPGMDGATLARLVRQERPAIQVILMSGYSEDVAPEKVAGEDDMFFLPKPFSLKQLASLVKEAMQRGA